EGRVVKGRPPVAMFVLVLADADVAGVDPVFCHRRDRPVVVGTDLEAVVDVLAERGAAGAGEEANSGRAQESAQSVLGVPLHRAASKKDGLKGTVSIFGTSGTGRLTRSVKPVGRCGLAKIRQRKEVGSAICQASFLFNLLQFALLRCLQIGY